ncbi:hypothetical protein Q8W40_07055 [Vibrio penaeicida]|uniref:hypothetical protein n=1 Tax=Vibrio penaeicida TaxID=104609 RepID=UPI0027372A5B|nr:hypothetical protein [Vibrio penaeicida]MDP2571930.1 hypothetical protein [Vibrio penaeicida]
MMIQVSGQYGDPKADSLFWPIQKTLNDNFKQHIDGEYFETINMFSIVFRVSGKVRDFGSEGPERIKHNKKDSEVTIDLVFPESFWKNIDKKELEDKVIKQVRQCIVLILEKSEKIEKNGDIESLKIDIENALSFLDV